MGKYSAIRIFVHQPWKLHQHLESFSSYSDKVFDDRSFHLSFALSSIFVFYQPKSNRMEMISDIWTFGCSVSWHWIRYTYLEFLEHTFLDWSWNFLLVSSLLKEKSWTLWDLTFRRVSHLKFVRLTLWKVRT